MPISRVAALMLGMVELYVCDQYIAFLFSSRFIWHTFVSPPPHLHLYSSMFHWKLPLLFITFYLYSVCFCCDLMRKMRRIKNNGARQLRDSKIDIVKCFRGKFEKESYTAGHMEWRGILSLYQSHATVCHHLYVTSSIVRDVINRT